jgi:mitogen-activated protein kinase 15
MWQLDGTTDSITVRFRSPEILIGSRTYGYGVDMWSLGCIMGEMLLGKALFPGQSTLNQLQKITEALGSPTK